jgi:hypothetical protein
MRTMYFITLVTVEAGKSSLWKVVEHTVIDKTHCSVKRGSIHDESYCNTNIPTIRANFG